jgi:hypothetical protein
MTIDWELLFMTLWALSMGIILGRISGWWRP